MAEGLGMWARGSIAPLHGRQPAHFWLHDVPRCTLCYDELKLRRNAWDALTNIPADAAIPVIFVFHGSMYSFICLPYPPLSPNWRGLRAMYYWAIVNVRGHIHPTLAFVGPHVGDSHWDSGRQTIHTARGRTTWLVFQAHLAPSGAVCL